jgi:endonuclease YncB( thermonuclease family)
LNGIYLKIDKIWYKDYEKVLKLWQQIDLSKSKYLKNEKIYYLLTKIGDYINENYNKIEYDFIKVLDWDTISIKYNWEEKKVRLIWINAPETNIVSYNTNCLWIESKEFLIKKLENISNVKIEFDLSQWKTDSFWRLLWYLYISWININQLLLTEWLASEYTYNKNKPYKYQNDFIEANKNAKENKIGIYSDKCNVNNETNTWSVVNQNQQLEKNSSNVFYTSSHYKSELYYCENDIDWEALSKSYLKKFNSENELLKVYPYKKLNKPCN